MQDAVQNWNSNQVEGNTDMILSEEEIALKEGIDHLGKFEHDLALKSFQKTAKQYPEAGIAWLFLGDVFLLLGEVKKAKAAHKKAVSFDSELWFPRLLNTPTPEGTEHRIMLGDYNGATITPGGATRLPREPIAFQRTLSLLSLGSGLQIQAGVVAASYNRLFNDVLEAEATRMKSDLDSDESKFGIWRELGTVLELQDRQDEAIAAYAKALALDPRDRLCQRGLIRTSLFKRNEIKYSTFAKHKVVEAQVQKFQEMESQIPEEARKKPSDIIKDIEIVQIAGNSDYVNKEFGKKDPTTTPPT